MPLYLDGSLYLNHRSRGSTFSTPQHLGRHVSRTLASTGRYSSTHPLLSAFFTDLMFLHKELGPRPELLESLFNTPASPESEDCLSINVFAPTTRFPDARHAVVVFIHGGGWQLGHGRLDLSAFAAYEGIIAVTPNYRTNVFGFPASPEIPPSEQNLCLHDQRLALAWVQDNIATFGGDPSKVALWGQSAGSFSVDHHLKAYAKDTLVPFHGAIMSSGQMSFGHLAHPSPGMEASIPAKTLISTMRKYRITFGTQFDNSTVLSKPGELWRNGYVVKLPILKGTVEEEGRGLVNDKVNMTAFFDAYLPPALVPFEDRETIISMYRSDPSVITDFDLASAIYTDFLWSCVRSPPTDSYQTLKLLTTGAAAIYTCVDSIFD
ncbi:hypothetical protein CSAL01_06041 [Colletotrichum salicis]|uniref:Carboxylic ester hydrolase n=1 Tax=Colletotrichum salicis TaxID=1209931 RepID=A0A135TVT7_9PEZI|nr:hypothetical protein CSAL01_06041 [Colletotrichum salicis]